jgi:Fe2+ transport system protein FeoA
MKKMLVNLSEEKSINLTELETGRPAKVRKLQGSPALTARLRSMGIHPGTLIIKKSAILAKGPIVVEKGSMQFAVGYDMAENILVEPAKQKN